jgi:signal transduction histidine kinase
MELFKSLAHGDHSWRYPTLVLLLESEGEPDAADRARALASDLAQTRPPADAVREVMGAGALESAERMIADLASAGVLDANELAGLRAEFDHIDRAAQEAFRSRCRAIVARAQRVGAPRPEGLADLNAYVDSRPVLEAEFAAIESDLDAWEATAREGLRARVAEVADADARADLLRLIDASELATAEHTLAEGRRGGHTVPNNDRPLEERHWALRSYSLEAVVNFFDAPTVRPAAVNRFVPPPEDTAGVAYIDALRDLGRGEEGARSRYLRAFQGLVGAGSATIVTEGDHEFVHLMLDDARLPSLPFLTERELRFVVSSTPVAGQRFRIALEVTSPAAAGEAVIDVATALSLLTPMRGRFRERADRCVLLLSAVCRQLDVGSVIDDRSFVSTTREGARLRLWWFFYLMGLPVDAAQLDALIDLSGGRLPLMTALAQLAVESAGVEQQAVTVAQVRESVRLTEVVRDAVLRDLGAAAALLLGIVASGCAADAGALEVQIARLLESRGEPVRARYLLDVRDGLGRLLTHGYVDDVDGLVSPGALLLLSDEDLDRWRTELLDTVLDDYRSDRAKRVAGSTKAATIEHATRTIQVSQLSGRDDQHVTVRRCCQAAFDELALAHPGYSLTVALDVPDHVELAVDPPQFWAVVLNLLNNAVEAAGEYGQVDFTVRADDGLLTVTVTDSGPGIGAAVVRRLHEGDVPDSSKHEGGGNGLVTVWETTYRLHGELQIDTAPDGTGAVVRLVLPIAE